MRLSKILLGSYKFTTGEVDTGKYKRTMLPFVKKRLEAAPRQPLRAAPAAPRRTSEPGSVPEKQSNVNHLEPSAFEGESRIAVSRAADLRKVAKPSTCEAMKRFGMIAYCGTFEEGYAPDVDAVELYEKGFFVEAKGAAGESRVYRVPPSVQMQEMDRLEGLKDGLVYGAHAQYVEINSNYSFNEDHTKACYMEKGRPVKVAFSNEDLGSTIYQLEDGRHMYPQPAINACTDACEFMLLLDQGYLSVGDLERDVVDSMKCDRKRTDEQLIESLRTRAQIDPIQNTLTGTQEDVLNGLQALLQEHGCCILSLGGHVVMLDAIGSVDGKAFLDIREPFHGISSRIEAHAEFWRGGAAFAHLRDNSGKGKKGAEKLEVGAISLPRKKTGQSSASSSRPDDRARKGGKQAIDR